MKLSKTITILTLACASAIILLTVPSLAQQTEAVVPPATTIAKSNIEQTKTIPDEKTLTAPASKTPLDDAVTQEDKTHGDSDKWHFEIRPYLWAAGLNGNLRVRNTTVPVNQDFSDILGQLDFALATQFEAGNGRWRLMIDENYVNLGSDVTGPAGNVTFAVEPTLNIFEGGASYLLVATPHKDDDARVKPPVFSVEMLGGVRYIRLKAGIRPNNGTEVEGSSNLTGFFVGNRFKFNVHPAVTLIGKYSVGTSGVDSNRALSGAGYFDLRFSRRHSVTLGYQVLDVKTDDPANLTGFDGQMKGVFLGFTMYR